MSNPFTNQVHVQGLRMASDIPFTLVPPYKQGIRFFKLYTEAQAREAFYSHEKRIRLAGRGEIVPPGSQLPVFMWEPSPTFGSPHGVPEIGKKSLIPTKVFTTTSLRTEFIMIAYTYVIMTVHNVVSEFASFTAKTERPEEARRDADELRDMCGRLYNVYLVLADRIKPHVLLHTLGNIMPACAELSVYTADAMLAFVTGYQSIIGLKLTALVKNTKGGITYKERRDVFLFVAQQFERTYTILTQNVWLFFGAGSTEQTGFQRYLLGSIMFYRAKVFLCAVEYEKQKETPNTNLISILAHKADYLLRVLRMSDSFGYREHASTLGSFAVKTIEKNAIELRTDAFYKKRITTLAEYNAGDRFMEFAIHESSKQDLLFMHHKKAGRMFRSDAEYCSLPLSCLFRSSQKSVSAE